MNSQLLLSIIFTTVFSLPAFAGGSSNSAAKGSSKFGGNTSGGGGPDTVQAGALKLLIEGGGLKKAMLNYIASLEIEKIEDLKVQRVLRPLITTEALQRDISTPDNYYFSAKGTECRDAYDNEVPASTTVGEFGGKVCFDLDKLVDSYRGLSEEDVMIRLASLAFHEHVHHFQNPHRRNVESNEAEANLIAGYVLVTAKFVQIPMLQWAPGEDDEDFDQISRLYDLIRSKEKRFLKPREEDYRDYPDYKNQADRGVIRLLPREKYDGKMSINGGASFFSFASQKHEYGQGNDINLYREELSVGFAGCDYGFVNYLGDVPLAELSENSTGIEFLANYVPEHKSEPAVRAQQRAALDGKVKVNGKTYGARVRKKFVVGDTFAVRSINFDISDILAAMKIVRIGKDGSLVLAWKTLKQYPKISCGR